MLAAGYSKGPMLVDAHKWSSLDYVGTLLGYTGPLWGYEGTLWGYIGIYRDT